MCTTLTEDYMIDPDTWKNGKGPATCRLCLRTFCGLTAVTARAHLAWVTKYGISICGGLSEDFILAELYGYARALRLADGPDEVHRMLVAKLEVKKQMKRLDERAAAASTGAVPESEGDRA